MRGDQADDLMALVAPGAGRERQGEGDRAGRQRGGAAGVHQPVPPKHSVSISAWGAAL